MEKDARLLASDQFGVLAVCVVAALGCSSSEAQQESDGPDAASDVVGGASSGSGGFASGGGAGTGALAGTGGQPSQAGSGGSAGVTVDAGAPEATPDGSPGDSSTIDTDSGVPESGTATCEVPVSVALEPGGGGGPVEYFASFTYAASGACQLTSGETSDAVVRFRYIGSEFDASVVDAAWGTASAGALPEAVAVDIVLQHTVTGETVTVTFMVDEQFGDLSVTILGVVAGSADI